MQLRNIAHDGQLAKVNGSVPAGLIAVLLLHRHTPHREVIADITAALQAGALTADAVALEARKAGESGQQVHLGFGLQRQAGVLIPQQ